MGNQSEFTQSTKIIFIPGNVPSSKNSKQISMPTTKDGRVVKGRNGKKVVIVRHSEQVQKYLKTSEQFYIDMQPLFKSFIQDKTKPLQIRFKFNRLTRHNFDYINALQIVQDLMVKHKWIDDDNADELKPIFDDYEYLPDNPGVLIFV